MLEFPNADQLITNNVRTAGDPAQAALAGTPARNLAVVTCMDSRIDVHTMLGIDNGHAHIIRNAGGVVTDDVIRSLCLSQRYLGTREILVIHHTKCGLMSVDEAAFRADLVDDVGVTPTWSLQNFTNLADDVVLSMRRISASPFVPHSDHIRGFVFDVDTGELSEVTDH